jgi:hypothetical protein
MKLRRNQYCPIHHHSGVEAIYVIQGEACYETPTRAFKLEKARRSPFLPVFRCGRWSPVDASPRPDGHRLRRVATPDNADGGSNRATARRVQVASPDSWRVTDNSDVIGLGKSSRPSGSCATSFYTKAFIASGLDQNNDPTLGSPTHVFV